MGLTTSSMDQQKSAEGIVPQKMWEGLKLSEVLSIRRMRARMYGGVRIGDREVP